METSDDITVHLVSSHGSDALIAAAAKVSTKGDMDFEGPHDKLINFLMKNRHGTPFEHNSMTFFVKAPIFVFREFHRHRVGWSYNEESGRYRELQPHFYVPGADRPIVQEGKPGHYTYVPGNSTQQNAMSYHLATAYKATYFHYQRLLKAGIAREVARMCLPVGIFSSMYATCNARSLMHFLSLRTKREDSKFPSFPQREIEMVAERMEEYFKYLFPYTYQSFNTHGRVAP